MPSEFDQPFGHRRVTLKMQMGVESQRIALDEPVRSFGFPPGIAQETGIVERSCGTQGRIMKFMSTHNGPPIAEDTGLRRFDGVVTLARL